MIKTEVKENSILKKGLFCFSFMALSTVWELLDEPFGSDHMDILISVDKQVQKVFYKHTGKTKNGTWKPLYLPSWVIFLFHLVEWIHKAVEASISQFKAYLGGKTKYTAGETRNALELVTSTSKLLNGTTWHPVCPTSNYSVHEVKER